MEFLHEAYLSFREQNEHRREYPFFAVVNDDDGETWVSAICHRREDAQRIIDERPLWVGMYIVELKW